MFKRESLSKFAKHIVFSALIFLTACATMVNSTETAPTYDDRLPSSTSRPTITNTVPSPTPDFLPELAAGRYVVFSSDGQLWAQPIQGGSRYSWPVRGEINSTLTQSIYAEWDNLYQLDLNSGVVETIPIEGIDMMEIFKPTWGPDLATVAFAASSVQFIDGAPVVDEFPSIYLFDLESNQATRLTPWDTVEVFPIWSPDGEWLAFSSDSSKVSEYGYQNLNDMDLFMIHIEGATGPIVQPEFTQLTFTGLDGYATMPSWEPSGRSLAFTCSYYNPEPQPHENELQKDICILDLETMHITNITNTPFVDEYGPNWSSDSNMLGYTRRDISASSIFTYFNFVVVETANWEIVIQSGTSEIDEYFAYFLDWPGE